MQKCGPNNTVDELKNLIRKVANLNNINPGKCMTPNCLNIDWKNTKTSMFEVPSWEKRAIAAFHFERAFSKVRKMPLQTKKIFLFDLNFFYSFR